MMDCLGLGAGAPVAGLAGSRLRRCSPVVSAVSWLPRGKSLSSCSKLKLLHSKDFGDDVVLPIVGTIRSHSYYT
jgi:hypothetical protein